MPGRIAKVSIFAAILALIVWFFTRQTTVDVAFDEN
jgi:hypothetical protein